MKIRYLLTLLIAVVSWAGDEKAPSDQELALQGDHDALKRIDRECSYKKPISCYSAAYLRHAGPAQFRDPSAARKDFLKSCDLGFLQGCATTGLLLHQDGKSDAAVAYNKRACDGGNVNGCSNLALQYVTGKGLPKNYAAARYMYKKACDEKFAEDCFNLGVMEENGEGAAADHGKAVHLYRLSCDEYNYATGCVALSKSIILDSVDAAERTRAYRMTRDICLDQVADSCFEMVALYSEGLGAPEEFDLVVEVADKQCRQGKGAYCSNLGVIYGKGRGRAPDPKKAAESYKLGCESGEKVSCFNLAVRLKSGDGVSRDVGAAEKLFKKTCKEGYQPACQSH